ncbi:hypothetical protein ACFLZZ_00560 [Nanoarchaeota archaeon]
MPQKRSLSTNKFKKRTKRNKFFSGNSAINKRTIEVAKLLTVPDTSIFSFSKIYYTVNMNGRGIKRHLLKHSDKDHPMSILTLQRYLTLPSRDVYSMSVRVNKPDFKGFINQTIEGIHRDGYKITTVNMIYDDKSEIELRNRALGTDLSYNLYNRSPKIVIEKAKKSLRKLLKTPLKVATPEKINYHWEPK